MTQLKINLNEMDRILQKMTAVSTQLQNIKSSVDKQAERLNTSRGIEMILSDIHLSAAALEKEIQVLNLRMTELRRIRQLYRQAEEDNIRLVDELQEGGHAVINASPYQRKRNSAEKNETSETAESVRMPEGFGDCETMDVLPENWKRYTSIGPLFTRKKIIHSGWLVQSLAGYLQ